MKTILAAQNHGNENKKEADEMYFRTNDELTLVLQMASLSAVPFLQAAA